MSMPSGRTTERRKRIDAAVLAALAAEPAATDVQIARALQVTPRTVYNVRRRIADQQTEIAGELAALRSQQEERMPMPRFVDRLAAVSEQNAHLPSAMNGLRLWARLKGWERGETQPPEQREQSLFSLPAGSRIAVEIGRGASDSED